MIELPKEPSAQRAILTHVHSQTFLAPVQAAGAVAGPLGINLSGYFRYLSGTRYARSVTASYLDLLLQNVDPTIYAEPRGTNKLPDFKRLDLRLEKMFQLDNVRLVIFSDVFNVFNANTASSLWTNSSNTTTYDYQEALNIMPPRIFQIGARIEL